MTTEQRQNVLSSMRARHHRTCPVCGDLNDAGLQATFHACPDGSVRAEVICGEDREGYAGHVHGGIIASLLDGAMTNCLVSHGIRAVTGELTVRMLQPIEAGRIIVARAWVDRRLAPLYHMKAELKLGDELVARGRASFMNQSGEGEPGTHRILFHE